MPQQTHLHHKSCIYVSENITEDSPERLFMSQNNRKSASRLSQCRNMTKTMTLSMKMFMWKGIKFHRFLPLGKEL